MSGKTKLFLQRSRRLENLRAAALAIFGDYVSHKSRMVDNVIYLPAFFWKGRFCSFLKKTTKRLLLSGAGSKIRDLAGKVFVYQRVGVSAG